MKTKMRVRKLRSGVNRQGALKVKGTKQKGAKQGLGMMLCFKNISPNHPCLLTSG
jgi:hypothetical protein